MKKCEPPLSASRRLCLKAALAAGLVQLPPALQAQALPRPLNRFALLVGNRDYPKPYELPPAHKNVRDLAAALRERGFQVTEALDQNAQAMQGVLDEYVQALRQCPTPPVSLFYFTGHGLQRDSDNLLLGAGASPQAPGDRLQQHSLSVQQKLIQGLPWGVQGLTLTVIDACRTDILNTSPPSPTHPAYALAGFNQLEAPEGGMIVFSTQAGRPAIAPDNPGQGTFFTEALVRCLSAAESAWTFSDLFRMVRHEVREGMLQHPLAVIRRWAQDPFIADNSRGLFCVGDSTGQVPSLADTLRGEERRLWMVLNQTLWPADVMRLSQAFLMRFPRSEARVNVLLGWRGATSAHRALQRRDLKLMRAGFELPSDQSSPQSVEDLHRASRGDKDAATRVGRAYGKSRAHLALFRHEAWMMFATALGSGIAAQELAVFYAAQGQAVLAAAAQAKALELGYRPAPGLPAYRK